MINPIELLRSKIDAAGGVRKYAASIGCSPGLISDVMHGRRAPGPAVLKPLGLERNTEVIVTYRRKRL